MLISAPKPLVDSAPEAHHPRMPVRGNLPWIAAAALGVVVAVMGGFLLARPAHATVTGARPEIRITVDQSRTNAVDFSQGTPTATVSYADGTQGDAVQAISGPWTPDRPIVMLVVVAQSACSIEINGELEDKRGAPINRLAVCVWTAP